MAPATRRVLSHARWSARAASQLLLQQVLTKFIGQQPLVVGIDETLERRWGSKINARGIYRDAVRSSDSHFVKCSGLRWVSVMRGRPCGVDKDTLVRPGVGLALFNRSGSF